MGILETNTRSSALGTPAALRTSTKAPRWATDARNKGYNDGAGNPSLP